MAKVVVIGAGIGGLSAAARLAKYGHKVSIYEASDHVGGKCRTEWIGDYAFDTGPSLLTLPAVFRDLFIRTGKRFETEIGLQGVDPAFSYHFADGTHFEFPNLSLPEICNSIEAALGKDAADEWHALMQRAERMWDASRGPFIESELPSLLQLLKRKGFLKDLRTIAPWKSLRSYTQASTSNPYLQKIVDRYATYSGSDPRKAPAVLLTIAFVESTFGAWHLEGGLGTLALALEKRCKDLGVDIYLNSPVQKINVMDGIANSISLKDGTKIQADKIVANADAELVYNSLLDSNIVQAKHERKKLARAEKSLAGFSLLIGLDNSKVDGELPQLKHHNVFFPENYDDEFEAIFSRNEPVPDPTIYICAPADPKMVKGENREAWFVLVNAPRHDPINGVDWRKNPEAYASKILMRLDALGLRVSERLDVMEFRTPADLEASVMAPGGSIYGTSSNGARAAFLRASNRSPISNLYCVGGSAHPGGGLPLVGMSAELVAEAIGRADGATSSGHNHH
jgi:phytoene desaturase